MTPLPAPSSRIQLCLNHRSGADQRPAVRFITGPNGYKTFYCADCGPTTSEAWSRMSYLGNPAEITAAYAQSQAPIVKAAAEIVTRPPILAELTPEADRAEAEEVIEADATRKVLDLLDQTRRAVVTVMSSQPLAQVETLTAALSRALSERERFRRENAGLTDRLTDAELRAEDLELTRASKEEENENLSQICAAQARELANLRVSYSELQFDLEEASALAMEAIDGLPSARNGADTARSEPEATPEPPPVGGRVTVTPDAPRARVVTEPEEAASESALALAMLELPKPLGGPKLGIEGTPARKSFKGLTKQDRERALTALKRVAEEGLAHPSLKVTHILQKDCYSVRASHRLRVMLRRVAGGYDVVEFVDRADRNWYASE